MLLNIALEYDQPCFLDLVEASIKQFEIFRKSRNFSKRDGLAIDAWNIAPLMISAKVFRNRRLEKILYKFLMKIVKPADEEELKLKIYNAWMFDQFEETKNFFRDFRY